MELVQAHNRELFLMEMDKENLSSSLKLFNRCVK